MRVVKQSEMYDSTYFYSNEFSQELHYYPFLVNLDEPFGSCNTL